MSLLDEIEARALRNTNRLAVADAAERAREMLDSQRAGPVLQRTETYLRRVAVALNGSDQIVKMSYAVPDVGELKELQQGNYRVSADAERDGAFRFAFECSGARSIKATLANEALARTRELALVEAGLRCRRIAEGGARRALVVEPRVPVSVEFHREGAGLKMRTRNLLAIESRSYAFAANQLDDEFPQMLLEVVLRRENRLPQLTGDIVDDASRVQLRKELARQDRRRRAERAGFFGRAVFPITEACRRLLLRE